MKKALLVVFLLVLLVAVSFIKSIREADKQKVYAEQGKSESSGEIFKLEDELDSLKSIIAQKEIAFADSMVQNSMTKSLLGDSLASFQAELDLKVKEISVLKKSISKNSKRSSIASSNKSSKKSEPKSLTRDQKTIKYYKKRYSDLPTDLSDYEKKVALIEIREETAKKFSISSSQLKKLRTKYNLNY